MSLSLLPIKYQKLPAISQQIGQYPLYRTAAVASNVCVCRTVVDSSSGNGGDGVHFSLKFLFFPFIHSVPVQNSDIFVLSSVSKFISHDR